MICNTFVLIIHEFALALFRNNQKKIKDPLKHMIYESSLCNRSNNCFLYFEINRIDLAMFKFDAHTEGQIIKRNENFDKNKIRFMVYNKKFIEGYYSLLENRYKFILHMIINAVIVLFMQYFIYYPFFCLSLMNPMDSISKCSTQLQMTFK